MLRTLFVVGGLALLGLILLKVVFGLLGPLVALLFMLLWLAVKVLFVGAVVYFLIRLVSPGTADRINRAVRGSGS